MIENWRLSRSERSKWWCNGFVLNFSQQIKKQSERWILLSSIQFKAKNLKTFPFSPNSGIFVRIVLHRPIISRPRPFKGSGHGFSNWWSLKRWIRDFGLRPKFDSHKWEPTGYSIWPGVQKISLRNLKRGIWSDARTPWGCERFIRLCFGAGDSSFIAFNARFRRLETVFKHKELPYNNIIIIINNKHISRERCNGVWNFCSERFSRLSVFTTDARCTDVCVASGITAANLPRWMDAGGWSLINSVDVFSQCFGLKYFGKIESGWN